MKRSYFQVTGRGSWCIDHPNGDSVAYRPGDVFEESPLNRSVQRGIRTKRIRELSIREARHRRMMATKPKAVKPKAGPPPSSVKTKPKDESPIVVLDERSESSG